ncbi:MAG: sulfatase [Candidatus Aminicenantes bacterium]|jgi:arylsulfatase A-like enzyme
MKRGKLLLFTTLCTFFILNPACKKNDKAIESRPNIIFIMADDHAAHAVSAYGSRINRTPNIDRIAKEGIRFTNCFCTNSICAPSRAVILTGKYSHLNGVRDNAVQFDGAQRTFPKILQEAGYQTAMIGKWHLKSDPTGFDYWNVLPGQGHYYNPDLIEMGEKKQHTGYVTDIITDIALDFLENRRDRSKPFLMMLHHKAPHRNWQPEARHLNMYDETAFPEPETLFDDYATRSPAALEQEMTLRDYMRIEQDVKMGDPPQRLNDEQRAAWEAVYGPKKDVFNMEKPEGDDLVRWIYKRYMEDYLGCVAAVDESVGRVLDYLDESGLAKNTVIVYTSDQGFFLGDHGWYDKRFMYEESLRMPLIVRLPKKIESGSLNDRIVSNLDFAPTFLELAGAEIPTNMQGKSLKKLLLNERVDEWRKSLYYHYYEYPAVHMAKRHYGVRTNQYKLLHFYYDIDAWELYDLEKDPNEINNVYEDPSYADVITELKAEIKRLKELYGDSDEMAQQFLQEDLERRKKRH